MSHVKPGMVHLWKSQYILFIANVIYEYNNVRISQVNYFSDGYVQHKLIALKDV